MLVKATTWVAGIVAAVAVGVPAQAQEFKDKSAINSCTPVSNEEVLKRPDGSSIRRNVANCISVGDLPFPFDYRKLTCTSTAELDAGGKLVSAHGYCDVLSTKGDRYASWTTFSPTELGRWGFFSGSGAYAGIKGGGTYKNLASMQGGGGVNQVIGSWQLGAAPTPAPEFKNKINGTNYCSPISNDEILKRPDGSSVRRTVGICITANDAAFPLDHTKLTCASTLELGADGKLISSHGYCDVLSTKGDRAAAWITFNPTDQGKWGYYSGGGAFAGIKGAGTYQIKVAMPGGGSIVQVTGSVQIDGATASK